MFVDFADDFAGSSHRDDITRDVLCDDGSCADDNVIADGHARRHDDASAEPAVLADMHGEVVLVSLSAKIGIDRMTEPGIKLPNDCKVRMPVKLADRTGTIAFQVLS